MSGVEIIKARNTLSPRARTNLAKRLRVAAYCRASTDTRQVSKVTWTEQTLSRPARTANPRSRLPVCVPILPTRLKPYVPIIVTTHVETVVLLSHV